MHHRWILFGKDRMGYFHKLHNKFYSSILNIDKLWSLLPQEVKASKENKASFTQFGPSLLSKIAKKKIKEAGSVVVLNA
ncbi:hypothetical protein JHK82_015966 [Glycine max]|nr:hypothetical protein JHK85_016362 [Glycine max]KAG5046584.1 hypothetical protein JHK86_015990 [Glycine max]KAG5149085.1 hypothetical protein JHK82_015966 [Glycine max]